MITTATNAVSPLSAVVSYQLLAFFPSLNEQESIATDTPQVRREFATLHLFVIVLNLSSLLTLPLLVRFMMTSFCMFTCSLLTETETIIFLSQPRQKRETREIVAKRETSKFWGLFVMGSAVTFLSYSTAVTFITVKYHDVYGCKKIFGGGGCSADESSGPALFLVSAILLYCYGTNFYLSYLPIVRGERKFTWRMFV